MNRATVILDHFKTQAEAARAIGCSYQTLNNWIKRRNVPAEWCPRIEKVTDGAIRCEQLQPDVDWSYLRGTNREAA